MLALFLAAALGLAQDGEVDRIQIRFQQRREKVRTEGEFRRLLADARLELEAFLKANPKHKDAPRAAFQVAETYLSAQDYEHALEQLQAYLKEYPGGPDVGSARFAIGEIHLEKERDEEARAAFEEFAKLYPKDDRAIFARMLGAVALQNQRKYDEAAEVLSTIRTDFPERKESWSGLMQLAVLRHVQEKNADARRTLEEIIRDCQDKSTVEIARRHLTAYLKVGQDAPGFNEKDIEGRETSAEKLRGKVVVVYFFEPAAAESLTEAAFLRKAREDAARAGRSDDFQVIGVSIGTDRKDMPLYKAQTRSDWSLFWDGRGVDGKVARAYDVRALPHLTMIDRKGKIRFFNVAGRDFRACAQKLLEEK